MLRSVALVDALLWSYCRGMGPRWPLVSTCLVSTSPSTPPPRWERCSFRTCLGQNSWRPRCSPSLRPRCFLCVALLASLALLSGCGSTLASRLDSTCLFLTSPLPSRLALGRRPTPVPVLLGEISSFRTCSDPAWRLRCSPSLRPRRLPCGRMLWKSTDSCSSAHCGTRFSEPCNVENRSNGLKMGLAPPALLVALVRVDALLWSSDDPVDLLALTPPSSSANRVVDVWWH